MQPLITVIVPVYNVEKYLDRCVESIVNQTYKNLEIILVDDGSPDNCPQMCDEWAKKDSRIKVIHKENGGVSSARNIGLDNSNGEYIGFVDSDDYIELDMYEIMYNSIGEFDICECGINFVNNSKEVLSSIGKTGTIYTNKQLVISYINEKFFPSIWCKIYKAEIIKKNNLRFDLNKKVGEDFIFNYYVFSNSNSACLIDKCLYNYVANDNSASQTLNYELINRYKNTKEIFEKIENKELYNIFLTKYQSELLCCLRELLRSNNKELINQCYNQICNEINNYSSQFLQLKISKQNRFSIKLICFNKKLFYIIYSLFLKLKRKR